MRKGVPAGRQGITLVEAVLVVLLVGIIAVAIAFYIREGVDAWRFLSGQKNMALSTRAAVKRVVRELKRAKKNVNITTHATKEITFLDIYDNTVTFSQEGTVLYRNSDVLLGNLQDPCGLAFAYLDKDGNETDTTNQIRVVRVRLTTVKDANRFKIESAARIRVKRIK